MANLGKILKEEIVRLSLRSARVQAEGAKKALSRHQRDIAELKRLMQALRRQMAEIQRGRKSETSGAGVEASSPRLRFSAKRLRAQRDRLGLSAAQYARLAGVSAQTIYNWERGATRPSPDQLAKLGTLRGLGKRKIGALLADAT